MNSAKPLLAASGSNSSAFGGSRVVPAVFAPNETCGLLRAARRFLPIAKAFHVIGGIGDAAGAVDGDAMRCTGIRPARD